ncbi:hypothetical protein ZWY2020_000062 [Hordeum vulgare]|nr:hypothetical protein ZWY2020_000062 [Hordeum vulgare]
MAESVVSIVLGNLNSLAVQETTFLCAVTLEVGLLKDELMRSGNARVAVLVGQIRDAAYEAENVIEVADYMEKRNRLKRGFMGAISRYAQIQRVRKKLDGIFASAESLKIDLSDIAIVEDEIPQDFGLRHQNSEDDIIMVGFQDEHKEIVDKLVANGKKLSAVSIVAMGGAGKTTLARKVCTSSRVKDYFHTVAWVTVSQTFKGIELLKDIMKQITGCTHQSIDQMQEYEVGKKIHDFLSKKRYLVILNDADTWEQLNKTCNAFPDATNGSRVLLTTRKEDVANHLHMQTHVHPLKKLDEEKSWELFTSKALPSYKRYLLDDVDEFEKLGRKLAEKCDGLPLALAVLGGYLSENLNTQAWSYLLLGWPSTKDTQMMRDILARSYTDLSSHYLRACFLYIAAFPEDFVISVSHLIQLWIAERFIPPIPNHKPEDTAHLYVTELAQRSLVQVVQRSKAYGRIEKIRIHDVLRDWCIEEARKDGFLDVNPETTGQATASSSESLKFYRNTLQNSGDLFLQTSRHLRTLVGFKLTPLPNMSFLRVLHIENSCLSGIRRVVHGCINLRYLRLSAQAWFRCRCRGSFSFSKRRLGQCHNSDLTSSIPKLLYLQTIDLTGTYSDIMPKSFWHILTLRHVYIGSCSPSVRSIQQNDLQTLSIGYCSKRMAEFVSQMTKLTTLSLSPAHDLTGLSCIFENMPHLVDISIGNFNNDNWSRSTTIIKEDLMPILEKLPCLVALKLEGYEGETMSCTAQGFPRLRELVLRRFSTEWILEDEAMPKLCYLELDTFRKMGRLPDGLLRLRSIKCLTMADVPLISGDDSTLEALQQKGCRVAQHLLPSFHFCLVLLYYYHYCLFV